MANIPDELNLHTKKGWQIPNETRKRRPPAAERAAVELFEQLWPGATFRSICSSYNCVGMVFATRRTIIQPEHIRRILDEDGYRLINDPANVDKGDIILYLDGTEEPSHVGMVLHKMPLLNWDDDPFVVLSKWGFDGEYIHPSRYVPSAYGAPTEFWTDRKRP